MQHETENRVTTIERLVSSSTASKIEVPEITNIRNTLAHEHLCTNFKEFLRAMHTTGSETIYTCNQMASYVDMMLAMKELLNLPTSASPEIRRNKAIAVFCDLPMYPTIAPSMSALGGGISVHNLQIHIAGLRLYMIPTLDDRLIAEAYNDLEKLLDPKHEDWKTYVKILCNYISGLSK